MARWDRFGLVLVVILGYREMQHGYSGLNRFGPAIQFEPVSPGLIVLDLTRSPRVDLEIPFVLYLCRMATWSWHRCV